jgi:DNA polymerase-3 subunit delta
VSIVKDVAEAEAVSVNDAATVAESVANSARYHVFKLSEALLAGDSHRAVRILDGLAAEGDEPTLVLWALTEDLRSILQFGSKPGNAARLFKGGPLRKERLAMAARRVPKRLAQELLMQAAQVDGMIKGSRKDEAWGALTRIATTLCIAAKNRAG